MRGWVEVVRVGVEGDGAGGGAVGGGGGEGAGGQGAEVVVSVGGGGSVCFCSHSCASLSERVGWELAEGHTGLSRTIAHTCIQTSALRSRRAGTCRSSPL